MQTEPGALRAPTIVIVEDDPDSGEILHRIVSGRYPRSAVFYATDGSEGAALFHQHQPDIVITDVKMPGVDGIDLVRTICKHRPDTKIILVTADSGRCTLQASTQEDFRFDHYLRKPIEFGLLFAAIEQCSALNEK